MRRMSCHRRMSRRILSLSESQERSAGASSKAAKQSMSLEQVVGGVSAPPARAIWPSDVLQTFVTRSDGTRLVLKRMFLSRRLKTSAVRASARSL